MMPNSWTGQQLPAIHSLRPKNPIILWPDHGSIDESSQLVSYCTLHTFTEMILNIPSVRTSWSS